MTAGPEERLARAALTYLAELADPAATCLLTTCDPASILATIRAGRLPAAARATATATQRDAISSALPRWHARSERLPTCAGLATHEEAGIRLVCPGDPGWPTQLDALGSNRPYALWLRGGASPRDLCGRCVSITGSRAATAYGSHVAAELAAALASRGWVVV